MPSVGQFKYTLRRDQDLLDRAYDCMRTYYLHSVLVPTGGEVGGKTAPRIATEASDAISVASTRQAGPEPRPLPRSG
jgi:hypothetical protein